MIKIAIIFFIYISLSSLIFASSFSPNDTTKDIFTLTSNIYNYSKRYKNVKRGTIIPKYSFMRKIPLTIIIENKSNWSFKEVMKELRSAENLYSECKVSFSPIEYITGDVTIEQWESDFAFFDDSTIFPITNKPIVIFDEHSRTPGLKLGAGYANPVSAYWTDEINVNSLFIFHRGYLLKKERPLNHQNYSLLGHELAHVLLNTGHNEIIGNILNGSLESRQDHFTEHQCEDIKSFKN